MNSPPPLASEDRHDTALARILHREGLLPIDTIQGALAEVRERRELAPGQTLAGVLLASGVLSGDQLDRAHSLLVAEGALRPVPAPPALEGGGFGPYRVQREVARGGMGVVYEVVHAGSGERYALKTLLTGAGGDPDEVARFRREAAALGQLDHVNVARVFAADVFGRTPYLVQELLTGGTLRERALRNPLGSGEVASLVEALAKGLAHSHAAGILHRDLKPENVLFDAEDVPKLVDFGLAFSTEASQRLTATGALLGTPAYMAPEQALGQREFDLRVDVYGLGGVLYFLLCGRPPFAGGLFEILEQVVKGPPERPSAIRPGVARGLEAICLKALAKDPGERFPDMTSFAAALAEEARASESAVPARGKRALALAALLTVLVALGGLAGLRPRGDSLPQESPRAKAGELVPEATLGLVQSPAPRDSPLTTPASGPGLGERLESWLPGAGALSSQGVDLAWIHTEVVTLERPLADIAQRGAAELHSRRPGVVRIWSLEDGREIGRLALEGLRPLKLEGSRDRRRVAVACMRAVVVFDTKTWARVAFLERPRPGRVASLAFSPRGESVALGAGASHLKDSVRVWDLASGAGQKLPLRGGALAFTDEATLAISTQDKGEARWLVFWSLGGERELGRVGLPKSTQPSDMDVSQDGAQLFVGCWSKTVSAWDVAARRLRKRVQVDLPVTRVQLDRAGETLVVTTGLRSLLHVDPVSLEFRVVGAAPGRSARDAVLLPEGQTLVVGTDYRLRLLDSALRPLWSTRSEGPSRTLSSTARGPLLANDKELRYLDANSEKLNILGPLGKPVPGRLGLAHVSRGGRRVWSVYGRSCRLLGFDGPKLQLRGVSVAPGTVHALAASEGRAEAFVIAALPSDVLRPARLSPGSGLGFSALKWHWLKTAPLFVGEKRGWARTAAPVAHVTSAGIGITGDWKGNLQAWDLDRLELGPSLGPGEVASAIVSLASDAGVVLAGTRDGRIRRWRPGGEELPPLRGHEGPVFALCVLPGQRLASVSEDGDLVIWDLEKGWQLQRKAISVGTPHLLHYREGVLFVATTSGHVQSYEFR